MKRSTNRRCSELTRQQGNAVLISIMLLSLLGALPMAQFAVVQKNTRASDYYLDYTDLHKYAESGIQLAIHDVRRKLSGDDGKIGTAAWSAASDYGEDGAPGTYDKGEGDGRPSIGEPNVFPQPIGPAEFGASLIVWVSNSAFASVQQVVATATNGDATVTVSTFVRRTVGTVPVVGPLFVDPDVVLDLKGKQVPHRRARPQPGRDARSPRRTCPASSPPSVIRRGTNMALLLGQIASGAYDQVLGAGGEPSLGEADGVDVQSVFDSFVASVTNPLRPRDLRRTRRWGRRPPWRSLTSRAICTCPDTVPEPGCCSSMGPSHSPVSSSSRDSSSFWAMCA